MTTDYTSAGVTSPQTAPGAPENVRAEIAQTRSDLGDTVTALTGKVTPRARLRGALSSLKTRTESGASRVRAQTRNAVGNRPVPAAVGALTVTGVVAAVIVGRRRAAKARSARNRWLPGFLHR